MKAKEFSYFDCGNERAICKLLSRINIKRHLDAYDKIQINR